MAKKLINSNQTSDGDFPDGAFKYIEPRLVRFNSGDVIEYYVSDRKNMDGKLVRRREKVNRLRKQCPNEKEFLRKVNERIRELTYMLKAEALKAKMSVSAYSLFEALDEYYSEKVRNARFDSIRVSRSQIKMLKEWLTSLNLQNIHVSQFSRETARQYLRYQWLQKQVSPCTYNNYIRALRQIFNWMIENDYCRENPFADMKKKEEGQKKRVVIPKEWDRKIMQYCARNDKPLALVCLLVYGSFLRPAEICRIRIRDIHLEKSAILVPAENAKNKHERWVVLPENTKKMLADMNLDNYPDDYYLVSKGLLPGPAKKETRDVDKHWTRMRSVLGMPKEFQLYSFRDTGIMDLKEQGVPDHLIVKLTGHLKTSMLEKYTHAPDLEALRLASNFVKSLGEREQVDYSQPSHFSSLEQQYIDQNNGHGSKP